MTAPTILNTSTAATEQLNFLLSLISENYSQILKEKPTFAEFAEEWLQIRVDNGISADNTVSYYKNLLNRILEFLGSMQIDQIRPMDIERFLNTLIPQYSQSTVHHYCRVLKSIFNYAEINGIIQKNVMGFVRIPGQSKRLLQKNVDFLTVEEAQHFLTELNKAPLRWQCMMKLLIQTGIRRGEACGLIWEDINAELSTISIRRNVTYSPKHGVHVGKLKTERSRRTLPLPNTLLQDLLKWKKEQFKAVGFDSTAFIFSKAGDLHTPLFPTAPTKWMSRFTSEHGLPPVSPHDLRHTCGSLMLASGASIKEVQDTLGHTDAAITLNYYVGTDEAALKRASNKLAASLGF